MERRGTLVQKKFREFFFPTLIMAVTMNVSEFVDCIIVSNLLGSDALAAVGLSLPIIWIYNAIFVLLGVGGSTVYSVLLGKRSRDEADKVFTVSMAGLAAAGVAIAIAGLAFLDPLAERLAGGTGLAPMLKDYLRALVAGAPVLIVVAGFTFFVRSEGHPRLASVVLVTANLVNLVMDFVYILVFHTGISGASVATVTGYAVGLVIVLVKFCGKELDLRLVRLRPADLGRLGGICFSGLSSTLANGLVAVKVLFFNVLIAGLAGASGVAVFSVLVSMISFIAIFICGSAQTMLPIVATLYGERDFAGIGYTLRRAFGVMLAMVALFVVLFELFPGEMLAIFGLTDPELVALGSTAIRIFSLSMPMLGFNMLVMYYCQTVGMKRFSIALSVCEGLAFPMCAAWALSPSLGLAGVWWAFPVAELASLVLVLAYGAWAAKRSGGKKRGVFMLEREDEVVPCLDVTIDSDIRQAVSLSESIIDFSAANGLDGKRANVLGLLAEEMAVFTIEFNKEHGIKSCIDILTKIYPDEVRMCFRSDGQPLDPTCLREDDGDKYDITNIRMIGLLAKNVDFQRVLGMNDCVITL